MSVRTHGNADGGLLQCGCVIDAVARHGRHLSLLLQHLDQLLLVLRLGAAEDEVAGSEDGSLLVLGQLEELGASEGLAGHIFLLAEDVHVTAWGRGREEIEEGRTGYIGGVVVRYGGSISSGQAC